MKIFTASIILLSTLAFIAAAPVEDVKSNSFENYTVIGDMLILKTAKTRNGIPDVSRRWPKGIIPYVIGSVYTASERNFIQQAMNDYHRYTCVHWVPRTNESEYVDIQRRTGHENGCWSAVGRTPTGPTPLNLGVWCVASSKSVSLHELNHAVGFYHEQSRIDRDDYITMIWANIPEGSKHNFDKVNTESFGVAYDYKSEMHYDTNPNKPTMIAKIDPTIVLGAGTAGFSPSDYAKIRRMYKCYGSTSLL